jgi:hypothetical protein
MKAKNVGLLAVALMGVSARSNSARPARVQRTQRVTYVGRIQ